MTISELIGQLEVAQAKHGDLPIVVYYSINERYELDHANVCSNRDHFLLVPGVPDLT